jgi:phosphate:Na+ symporter
MLSSGPGVLLGGVGLFLLGMVLMTDGLKTAAGPLLGRVLSSSTATGLRGLLSGILVTALVQSSSAVTVAAIGFVNAGLLTFSQSLWVLFGANVGTTMTGWLVALVGLKIKVELAALPLVGAGMALRVSGPGTRRGALGTALAGFGVLFLGIGFLQQGFSSLGQHIDLSALPGHGLASIPAFLLAGLMLTVLMQSSSASLAIVLTLAESGLLPIQEAAAAVIGANIGTTVTALLAAIGATPNAKRAAGAHVLFNLLTALVALALLPVLIAVVAWLRDAFGMGSAPAASLALFHTVFNLLGVLLMWPLASRLAAFLKRRFRTAEEEGGRPRYLDRNVASVPSLAVDALRREIARLGGLAIGAVWARIGVLCNEAGRPDEGAAVPLLSGAIADFVARLSRASMSESTAAALADLLRAQHYYDTCGELAAEISASQPQIARLQDAELRAEILDLLRRTGDLLLQVNPAVEPFAAASAAQRTGFEERYQALKARLLATGARGALDLQAMDALLRSFSALRRIVDQATKAARLFAPPQAAS